MMTIDLRDYEIPGSQEYLRKETMLSLSQWLAQLRYLKVVFV